MTVEIGNTDAEGRLVMCDALAEADGENPDMILDFATLTGAARVALGTDLPALFCNNDDLAADLARAGDAVDDPLWRLPLWRPYRQMLESKVADINNVSKAVSAVRSRQRCICRNSCATKRPGRISTLWPGT